MSRVEISECSLDNAGISALAPSINKINQLVIKWCSDISVRGWTELAKHISNRNSPVS